MPIDAPIEPCAGSLPQIDLLTRLQQARPRLLRLTRAFGVPADAGDDMVQETVIRGWQRFEQLRDAERFDAWLDAICRHQCQMYVRGRRAEKRHADAGTVSLEQHAAATTASLGEFAAETLQVPDAQAVDPWDALEREEVARLLDRALGYLTPQARAVLELHYLRGLSAAEAAETLGVSAAALELRLHRARGRLRETLAGPLRLEAEAFGLTIKSTPTTASGATEAGEQWQTTRILCYLCGRRPLLGRFEQLANGRTELRLRCPTCSQQHGGDVFRSKGIASLENLHAFRPALTRAMRAIEERAQRSLATGSDICLHCGDAVQRQVVTRDAFPDVLSQRQRRHWSVAACARAGCSGLGVWAAVEPTLWSDAVARQFMAEHSRWVLLPEEVVDWQGRPAIRCGLDALTGKARLTLVVDRLTLRPLAHVHA